MSIIECKKKTFIKLKLKNDLGFTFSPIENNNNSTPIFDGMVKMLFVSDKLIYEKKNPELINPISIGKDKTLNIYPNIRAPLNQINTVSIPFYIHKQKKICLLEIICYNLSLFYNNMIKT